jgi:hypothetical protein
MVTGFYSIHKTVNNYEECDRVELGHTTVE